MKSSRLKRIADAWIAYNELPEKHPDRETHWWAVSDVMDWVYTHHAERLWQFILLVHKENGSRKVIANLAAGPLEDLLVKHGDKFIDRVIKHASEDEGFNYLLGGVWKNDISDLSWNKIQSVRKNRW